MQNQNILVLTRIYKVYVKYLIVIYVLMYLKLGK